MKSIGRIFLNVIITFGLGSTVLLNSTLSVAQTDSINLIANPGFENQFSGWVDTDPSSESDKRRSGQKSAKIHGHDGRIAQTVSVIPNTDYILSAYVLGFARIGVQYSADEDDNDEKRIHNAESWTPAEIEFNSGSSTAVTVYANFYREEGRYDDFFLAPKYQVAQSTSTLLTQCPGSGNLPISSVFDDGLSGDNPPENVIDGNLANRWSSKGLGKKITLGLDSIAEVKQLDVMWYKGNERISLFSVETSIDGNNWQPVLSDASSFKTSSYDSYDIENFIDSNARYVRIIGGGNSSNEWNSITEVKLQGCVQ